MQKKLGQSLKSHSVYFKGYYLKNVLKSEWKSRFTLHKPGGGHGPKGSPLQLVHLVPKSELLQASVVAVVAVKSG